MPGTAEPACFISDRVRFVAMEHNPATRALQVNRPIRRTRSVRSAVQEITMTLPVVPAAPAPLATSLACKHTSKDEAACFISDHVLFVFSSSSGAKSCCQCCAGFYANSANTGSTNCNQCPASKKYSFAGSNDNSDCVSSNNRRGQPDPVDSCNINADNQCRESIPKLS